MAIAAPLPDAEHLEALTATRPALRLLSFPGESSRAAERAVLEILADPPRPRCPAPRRARWRRHWLMALLASLLAALAVPVSALAGTNGPSGSTLVAGTTYVVRPGDTMRSIALRLQPTADPAPLVAEIAAESGSNAVVPGEHLVLP